MHSFSLPGFLMFVIGANACMAPPEAVARAKTTEKKVWCLQQNSDQYGVITTVLSTDAVHMTTGEFVMGISAPKYDLVMVNTETKRYMIRPTSVYDALGRKQLFDKRSIMEVKKGKTGKIAGLNATQYLFHPKGYRVTLEWWCTDDLSTSEALNQACAKFSGLSGISNAGFLLRYSHTNSDGRHYVYVDTIAVKKVDPLMLKFKVPPEYKKVTSAMELIAPSDAEGMDSTGYGVSVGAGRARVDKLLGASKTFFESHCR